jgi:hypothetical protein
VPPMLSQVEPFIHRDYAALVAAVPALALGSLAVFAGRDRAARSAARTEFGPLSVGFGPAPRPAGREDGAAELALVGVILAAMADRLEHDPAAYPLLACAAAHLVPPRQGPATGLGWTGLTERARRAAVDVLRPTALSTLVRAATWGLVLQREARA